MHSLNKRIYSGLGLAGVFALIILRAPTILAGGLLAIVAAIAMAEFYSLIRQIGMPVFKRFGLACGVILTAATFGLYLDNNRAQAAEYELAVLFGIILAVFIRQFPQKLNGQPFGTIACTLLGIFYVPFLFNFFIKLGLAWDQNSLWQGVGLTGRLLSFYLIAVVKCTDIGAFLIGSRFGKHKLFPRLSPGKTWEGFAGGLLFGLGISLALFLLCHGHFGHKVMALRDALILGIALPLLGMAGDLIESLLKRAGGAKDTGAYIPGMGGLLDVLDSLLTAVPFFYFYALFILPTV